MMGETNVVASFTDMHDDYHAKWNQAMITGDVSSFDYMADEYYVAFFRSETEKPLFFTKQEAIDGMKQSVMQFKGAQKKFENRVIRMKNNETAVVFYEQVIEKNGYVVATLFTIEYWKLVDHKWKIIRETEEPIN
ncbi:nuclear transport factor 2 family protein [Bacillus sp. BGMRC 2118]|nr:nuclear transport factor 2 family protein [Bacillus sp. BGMRC 2118]